MPRSATKDSTTTTRTTRSSRPRTPAPAINLALTHDDIAIRAYHLFLNDGGTPGRELEHWLKAESELREQTSASER